MDNGNMATEKTNSHKPDESDAKRLAGSTFATDRSGQVLAADKKVPELKKMFGKNLGRIRKEAGYSQTALSVGTGMTRNFINELEQGIKGASFLTLAKLSLILRAPVHEFFEPTGKEPPIEDLQDSDRIDRAAGQLHKVIDLWNGNRTE
jgi:transcriptional regulator with XRE-family HTH domain